MWRSLRVYNTIFSIQSIDDVLAKIYFLLASTYMLWSKSDTTIPTTYVIIKHSSWGFLFRLWFVPSKCPSYVCHSNSNRSALFGPAARVRMMYCASTTPGLVGEVVQQRLLVGWWRWTKSIQCEKTKTYYQFSYLEKSCGESTVRMWIFASQLKHFGWHRRDVICQCGLAWFSILGYWERKMV